MIKDVIIRSLQDCLLPEIPVYPPLCIRPAIMLQGSDGAVTACYLKFSFLIARSLMGMRWPASIISQWPRQGIADELVLLDLATINTAGD